MKLDFVIAAAGFSVFVTVRKTFAAIDGGLDVSDFNTFVNFIAACLVGLVCWLLQMGIKRVTQDIADVKEGQKRQGRRMQHVELKLERIAATHGIKLPRTPQEHEEEK